MAGKGIIKSAQKKRPEIRSFVFGNSEGTEVKCTPNSKKHLIFGSIQKEFFYNGSIQNIFVLAVKEEHHTSCKGCILSDVCLGSNASPSKGKEALNG
jgi:hypothetical protein